VLPALLPFFFAALRVGSARAITAWITAELFFAAVNLGAIMKRATQNSTVRRFWRSSSWSACSADCPVGDHVAGAPVLHWL